LGEASGKNLDMTLEQAIEAQEGWSSELSEMVRAPLADDDARALDVAATMPAGSGSV
jgi:hypothetical protein